MRQLAAGLLTAILLTACGTSGTAPPTNTPPPLNAAGAYAGTMTATTGASGVIPFTITIARDGDGYTAVAVVADAGVVLNMTCGPVQNNRLECMDVDVVGDSVVFEGTIVSSAWSGEFAFRDASEGNVETLAGTFLVDRQ